MFLLASSLSSLSNASFLPAASPSFSCLTLATSGVDVLSAGGLKGPFKVLSPLFSCDSSLPISDPT